LTESYESTSISAAGMSLTQMLNRSCEQFISHWRSIQDHSWMFFSQSAAGMSHSAHHTCSKQLNNYSQQCCCCYYNNCSCCYHLLLTFRFLEKSMRGVEHSIVFPLPCNAVLYNLYWLKHFQTIGAGISFH